MAVIVRLLLMPVRMAMLAAVIVIVIVIVGLGLGLGLGLGWGWGLVWPAMMIMRMGYAMPTAPAVFVRMPRARRCAFFHTRLQINRICYIENPEAASGSSPGQQNPFPDDGFQGTQA